MSSIAADPTCNRALSEVHIEHLLPLCAYGPAYLAHSNLMSSSFYRESDTDTSLLHLLIGALNTYTRPHVDFMGLSSWLQVVSGTKLWVTAPPKSTTAFFALFNESVNTSHFRKHEYDTFSSMGGVAFLQSAGDIIVMPGGWPHFVYNLTPTVAFGGSHLRLEGLSMLEKYITTAKH